MLRIWLARLNRWQEEFVDRETKGAVNVNPSFRLVASECSAFLVSFSLTTLIKSKKINQPTREPFVPGL